MRTLPAAAVQRTAAQFPGPQPAKVTRVVGSNLYVELDNARGLEVECKWSRPLAAHSHSDPDGATGTYTPPAPPTGTRCLVLFSDLGMVDAWVVAWNGWPA